MEIIQELVREWFDYKDGFLYWKKKHIKGHVKIGERAGYISNDRGRLRLTIRFYKKLYYASRLIFLYHNGWLPEIVDHEDINPLNNKVENLRAADKTKNNRNCTSAKNSSSKYLGVYFHKRANKWAASISPNRICMHLGLFINENDAAIAYNKAAKIHFGEFANLNIIE